MNTDSALVVLSGGQDSTTCLYWALDRFDPAGVAAVTFDYGQRHSVELASARAVAEFAGVTQVELPIDTFAALGGNALTEAAVPVGKMPPDGLPNTFVPGRNLVFLTFAAAYAYQRGIADIVTGVAQTDYSGYPDCRESTLIALQRALSLGMDTDFRLHTPLMHLSKKETVQMAQRLGALPAMALTHTCYEGKRPPCGACPACQLRAQGFAQAGIPDPLVENP
jgi:7-cyano-7-deazaguanine synthase